MKRHQALTIERLQARSKYIITCRIWRRHMMSVSCRQPADFVFVCVNNLCCYQKIAMLSFYIYWQQLWLTTTSNHMFMNYIGDMYQQFSCRCADTYDLMWWLTHPTCWNRHVPWTMSDPWTWRLDKHLMFFLLGLVSWGPFQSVRDWWTPSGGCFCFFLLLLCLLSLWLLWLLCPIELFGD